ncbi:proteasome accessory factor PafA2 [Blastococcus sp. MG754426]|uniref:depupylase/deamidase Dop n=1 Tax=unclassified Blastococcus TaxID=2619396 RepID=UPI002104DD3F|nr:MULTISPECIES: depupylase/deamidase Dop [unclassified Blastococcus]MCF6508862.1 proteasome accessory factor PafA2 [Blastococcus sp. MG754426]MCF6512328.1 proteasome accessory factor PafA2 [Blastococcus sp. MG754427]MCF6734184.1 proteasome accessory factor PafA2 [Blastococcus sp. KM273129]
MSVRRVMGTEVEYGISVPRQPGANPTTLSSLVVNAWAVAEAPTPRRPRWDFEEESPLRDARGFDLTPAQALDHNDLDEDTGMANVILTNGARLYVDHAHPEYSTPEVTTPRDIVLWDKAGERVMAEAARRAAQVPGTQPIQLYKNNTDGKGASYGAHENYLMDRRTPFIDIIRGLVPFFVTRQVFAGSGKVGIGVESRTPGFQLSQRADFFEVEVGLETTLKRPIINTRDEPHANPDEYRRLHVIIGDANLAELSTYLKVGTTSLVLAMIEGRALPPDLAVEEPVAELQAVSHDPSLTHKLRLRDGRRLTAIEVQRLYLERAERFVETRGERDEQTDDVLRRWAAVLDDLEADPMRLADQLDWPAKLRLLEGYRSRDGLEWTDSRLQMVDLQYSDVRPDKGLYNRLVARGAMQRLLTDEEVARAVLAPPSDTRAFFRGECLRRFPAQIAAASWDSVVFDLGRENLVRIPTMEPLRGTREHVGALFEASATAQELVDTITGP